MLTTRKMFAKGEEPYECIVQRRIENIDAEAE
jgi:hypothetical protein